MDKQKLVAMVNELDNLYKESRHLNEVGEMKLLHKTTILLRDKLRELADAFLEAEMTDQAIEAKQQVFITEFALQVIENQIRE